MRNAEQKAKDLIRQTITGGEIDSYMPGVIGRLLGTADPEDLVELGYSEYLREYLREYEGNIDAETEAAILESLITA